MNTVRGGALAGVTVAAGAAALFGPPALSVPGGLLTAFVLPGLALVGAVFRPGRDVGVVERVVLVPALSLAALVLGGLGWWAIGGTLNRAGWLSPAVAVTLVAIGAAVARERFLPPAGPAADEVSVSPEPAASPERDSSVAAEPAALPEQGSSVAAEPGASPGAEPAADSGTPAPGALQRRLIRDVLPLALAAMLLTGIGWWSFADSERVHDVAVTSLSAAPPGPVGADGNRQVQVSAAGLAPDGGPYRLVLSGAEGEEITGASLTPDADGDWTGRLSVPGEERVTVDLFRSGESAALRTVIIAAAQ